MSQPPAKSAKPAAAAQAATSIVPVPKPEEFPLKNEPILTYKRGSKERGELQSALEKMAECTEEVPIVIGSEEIKTDLCKFQVMV